MDHLGPFIKSKRGNCYILGIINAFSKFILVKGAKNSKSNTTIKILEDFVFGHPKVSSLKLPPTTSPVIGARRSRAST